MKERKKERFPQSTNILNTMKIILHSQAMCAPGIEAVTGPADVMNCTPLYVHTPPAQKEDLKLERKMYILDILDIFR